MTKPIKITVSGTDDRGGDAPTVKDLLEQIKDFVCVLREVESACSEKGGEIVWRVTDARKNSPLTIEVTPTPKQHAMNIDARAEKVVRAAAIGFQQIAQTGERPAYFTDQVLGHAAKVYARAKNGLATTNVDFGEYGEDIPALIANPESAREVASKMEALKQPAPIAHRELGSLEGFIAKVELDGFGKPIVWLKSRLDGQLVKCISDESGLDGIGHFEVSEVLRGLRVRVHGMMHFKDLEQIATIDVEGVHVYENDDQLPGYDKIVSPNFTNGIEASEYLRELHIDG